MQTPSPKDRNILSRTRSLWRGRGDKKQTLLDSLVQQQDLFNDLFSTKLIELVKRVEEIEAPRRVGRVTLALALLGVALGLVDLFLLLRLLK
jgi:hypothetical protein